MELLRKKRKKFGLLLGICLLMFSFALAGCQNVGGVNLNEALVFDLDNQSYEGEGSVSLQMSLDDSLSLDAETEQLLDIFSNSQWMITDYKQEDLSTCSFTLEWRYGDHRIVSDVVVEKNQLVFDIEGLDEPIVLDMSYQDELLPIEMVNIINKYEEKQIDVMMLMADFFFQHMSNPPEIDAEQVTEEINDEQMELTHVRAVIRGDDLLPLTIGFLEQVSEDTQGLKQLIGDLYDIIAPMVQEVLEASGEMAGDEAEILQNYLNNKTLAVEFIYETIAPQIENGISFLTELSEEAKNNRDAQAFLNEHNYLAVDLYVDEDDVMRKQRFELVIAPQYEEAVELKELRLQSDFEVWNINGDVQADHMDTTNSIQLNMGQNMTMREFYAHVDHTSTLYELLDQWNLNEMSFYMYPYHAEEKEMAAQWDEPFIEDGVTYVPIRLISDRFGATIKYDNIEKKTEIQDFETGKTISFKADSHEAIVNGETVSLPNETTAQIVGQKLYVPLSFITQQLEVEMIWESELDMIRIVKRY